MRLHTGVKMMLAASALVGVLEIAYATFDESGSNACHAVIGTVSEARSGALKAVEKASEFDDDARDAAAMAFQRWQATLERATRVCGLVER